MKYSVKYFSSLPCTFDVFWVRIHVCMHVHRLLGTPFAADLEFGHCYATMPGARLVASCGYWDNSVRCYSVEDGRLLQSLRQHKDIVTCIAIGADGDTLVTGRFTCMSFC